MFSVCFANFKLVYTATPQWGSAVEMPVKFLSDAIIVTSNPAASRLHTIMPSYCLMNKGPDCIMSF